MKNILLIMMGGLLITSCNKQIEEKQTDPNNPTSVPPGLILGTVLTDMSGTGSAGRLGGINSWDNVQACYNLPASVLGKKAVIQNASISFVGRNLLYFFPSRYKDLDVDQYTQDAGSGLQTPTTRSFGFNINLSF